MFDQVKVGNYRIVNCGSHNALMQSLLEELLKAIKPAVKNSKRRTASPAFSTFFNDITFAPYVNALFTNVTTGVALVGTFQTGSSHSSPLLLPGQEPHYGPHHEDRANLRRIQIWQNTNDKHSSSPTKAPPPSSAPQDPASSLTST